MQIKSKALLAGILISLSFLFAGCVSVDSRTEATRIASTAGLNSENIPTRSFVIATWGRFTPPVNSIRVYIEGDGFAWKSRTQPSDDPTPHKPTGLKLAAADPGQNVLYLARPCQFIGPPLPATCQVNWWTNDRFSAVVIDTMNEALEVFASRYPGVKLDMVGYSGGGNIAALLAARRKDVRSLRTVAGNLDVAWVNTLHNVTPMPNAISAIDRAAELRTLPQIHYSGDADKTVPVDVARRFQQVVGGNCIRVEVVSGMTHSADWAAIWPQLLKNPLPGC
ncbi:TPA: alpha/beta hydrolase [Enterobacter asburiae]|nr:alpha/beta hydrolase [Enterobacter asburiae]HDR2805550.1 alpha/beta hydrolase [Enterobacter asburiae]HDR2811069.1 alpha/beta hydrolase [Enterobacter asburiae]HDR2816560.1 alpha/beta hydrolase [Enterobacter asburiae]